MLTESEWANAYRHLIGRLRELELDDLAVEIEAAAASRIVEEYQPPEPGLFSRAELSEQGETVTRARMPSEAWQAAVSVLHARLVEAPRIAERCAELLGRDLGQIIFLPDAREGELLASEASFALSDLAIPVDAIAAISREVNALLTLTGMPINARSNTD